ncbi:hypothetical protein MRX96_015136 [Rhipicephalus microplus]
MDVPSKNTAAGSRRADEGESVAAVVRFGGQWRVAALFVLAGPAHGRLLRAGHRSSDALTAVQPRSADATGLCGGARSFPLQPPLVVL